MADPVVTITNGVPTTGTGTISTLGQVVAPQGASTSTGESGTSGPIRGPMAQGATVSSAPSYANGTVNPLTTDLAGNLRVNTVDPSTYNAGTAWNSSTGLNTAAALLNTTSVTYSTVVGQITQTTTITGGAITFEESFDNGTTWKTVPQTRVIDPSTTLVLANPYTCQANVNQPFQIATVGVQQVRARLSTVIAGTGSVTVQWVQGPTDDLVSVVQSGAPWVVQGDVANGSTDGNNPIKIGGLAKTVNPTAVSDGQRVNGVFDKQGKQIVVGAIRALKGKQKTSITSTSETTIVTAGAANVFQDLYGLVLSNLSATAVNVAIKDATAGTTQLTFMLPAGDTRGMMLPVDSAIPQTTAANNWTATVSGAVTSIEITALFVSNL